jgi:hypothetical protein
MDIGVDANPVESGADVGSLVDARLDASVDTPGSMDIGVDAIETGVVLRDALRAKSVSCLSCAESSCPGETIGCGTIGGTPDAGRDAAALSRSQLCVDTLVCVLATSCDSADTATCYCGDGGRGICWVPDVAKGECKSTIERGFETTDPKRILEGLESSDRETGGGWAFLLARCLRDNACMSCFGRPDAGADAAAEPDIRIDVSTPPVDVRPDLGAPIPDVQPEAEASRPRIDVTAVADGYNDDASNDAESDTDNDVDASLSDADSDI